MIASLYPNYSSTELKEKRNYKEHSIIKKKVQQLAILTAYVQYPVKNYRCYTDGPISIMGNNYSCMFLICSA